MLPFRVSVVPASSQPADSTSPSLEGDVSLRRYLVRDCRVVERHEHVPEVRARDGGTHGGNKIRVEAVAPPDTSSQLSALKHLRRVGVLFRRTVSWRGVLALIPGKPLVPHCWELP